MLATNMDDSLYQKAPSSGPKRVPRNKRTKIDHSDPKHKCSPYHVRIPAHCRLKRNAPKKKKVPRSEPPPAPSTFQTTEMTV